MVDRAYRFNAPCAVAVMLASIAGLFCAATLLAGDFSPEQWLESERGLIQRKKQWLLPLEVEMERRAGSLGELEHNLRKSQSAARQSIETVVAVNLATQKRIAALETDVQALLRLREEVRPGARKKFDAKIKPFRDELDDLRKRLIAPEALGGQPQVCQSLVDLTNRRNELSSTLLWIHDARPVLRGRYEELAADRRVQNALAKLGDHQLGSGKDYDADAFLRMLAGYEQLVFTDELPLYRTGGELRVAGFINRTPVTFTWHESSEPTMLTASVIEATGLAVPDGAPRMKRPMLDGSMLTVRQFEVPYLRFGRHVLKDVTAYALPPEAENLGTQIGPAAFDGHSPKAEPENFRLVIH